MRRREAACKLQRCFGVSERRACRTLDQPRSSQRYEAKIKEDEPRLIGRIRQLVGEFPPMGIDESRVCSGRKVGVLTSNEFIDTENKKNSKCP